jgi:hypothetical protein
MSSRIATRAILNIASGRARRIGDILEDLLRRSIVELRRRQSLRMGTDHVAHIEEIALRIEIADPQDRLPIAPLDADDLGHEGRHDEAVALAGPVWLNGRSRTA